WEVLIRGRRHPIAELVTMDQLMVDVGDEPVERGDEVVLLGAQGGAQISATEWAERLGTIAYEIVTGSGTRTKRIYTGVTSATCSSARAWSPASPRACWVPRTAPSVRWWHGSVTVTTRTPGPSSCPSSTRRSR